MPDYTQTNLITTAEMADIRAAVNAGALPEVCDIISRGPSNTKGSQTVVEATIATDTPCRLYADQRENSRSYNAGMVMSTMTEWVLTLPWGTTIHNGYYVEIAGQRYEVVGVYDNPSFGVCVRCDLVRLHVNDPR